MNKWMIALIIVGLLVFGAYKYLDSKRGYVPDWYTEEQAAPEASGDMTKMEHNGSIHRIEQELARNSEVEVTEEDLNAAIVELIEKSVPGSAEVYIRALRSEITDDSLKIEMVIDLDDIPWNRLPENRRAMKTIFGLFASGENGELYLQFAGKPVVDGNEILFDQNSTIQFGGVKVPFRKAGEFIGTENKDVGRIEFSEIPFSTLELRKDKIILKK